MVCNDYILNLNGFAQINNINHCPFKQVNFESNILYNRMQIFPNADPLALAEIVTIQTVETLMWVTFHMGIWASGHGLWYNIIRNSCL